PLQADNGAENRGGNASATHRLVPWHHAGIAEPDPSHAVRAHPDFSCTRSPGSIRSNTQPGLNKYQCAPTSGLLGSLSLNEDPGMDVLSVAGMPPSKAVVEAGEYAYAALDRHLFSHTLRTYLLASRYAARLHRRRPQADLHRQAVQRSPDGQPIDATT